MKKNKTIFYTFLLSLASCSQFSPHRSFQAEMEHDDSSFYNPSYDFPIVGGDTGLVGESRLDRKLRTPASVSELDEDRGRTFLKQELRQLESKLADEDADLYETHKRSLATTSEKIYFLKLSSFERQEYLSSRGFMSTERASEIQPREMFGVRQIDLSSGMTKTDVVSGWGPPMRVEIAGNPSFENERWLYKLNGATKYIYFESGHVEGWE